MSRQTMPWQPDPIDYPLLANTPPVDCSTPACFQSLRTDYPAQTRCVPDYPYLPRTRHPDYPNRFSSTPSDYPSQATLSHPLPDHPGPVTSVPYCPTAQPRSALYTPYTTCHPDPSLLSPTSPVTSATPLHRPTIQDAPPRDFPIRLSMTRRVLPAQIDYPYLSATLLHRLPPSRLAASGHVSPCRLPAPCRSTQPESTAQPRFHSSRPRATTQPESIRLTPCRLPSSTLPCSPHFDNPIHPRSLRTTRLSSPSSTAPCRLSTPTLTAPCRLPMSCLTCPARLPHLALRIPSHFDYPTPGTTRPVNSDSPSTRKETP